MARKSSQQSRSLPKNKATGAETEASLRGKSTKAKIFPKDNLPNCDQAGDQFTGSPRKNNCVSYSNGTGKGPGKFMKTEDQEKDRVHASKSHCDKCREGMQEASTTETLDRAEANEPLDYVLRCPNNAYYRFSYALKGRIENLMENVKCSDNVIVRTVRRTAPYIMRSAGDWLEKQRPWLIGVRTRLVCSCDYAKQKIELAYPVVLKWLVQFGNVMLLLMMIWLDCTLRGIDSFLRLGTTSFFSFVWCAVFSTVAMVGISKFLLVMVGAVLTGLFIGITIGLIILAICGTLALWFYGSFWTTSLAIVLGGLVFALKHERLALLIATLYSIYSAWTYVGFLVLLLGLNLSFISSDALIYFMRNSMNQPRRSNKPSQQAAGNGQAGVFDREHTNTSSSEAEPGLTSERNAGAPSTSGSNSELTSEDEIVRLLNCSDHYSVFGLSKFEDVDASFLKREYRKKAMLVHPDKNQGNEKAVEAFKKLQNSYEVLLDSSKRKEYDDELRREELLNCFRRFQNASEKNGGPGFFPSGFPRSEGEGDDLYGEPRRITCKRCNSFHIWFQTKKLKSRARWCQDCKDFHQAKDGDGWLEQDSQPFLYGLLQKVNPPIAYVCAESKIYVATEWYICQGMRCPANTHKPSFHVNTNATFKHSTGKGAGSGQKGSRVPPSMEETMTEEEFFEWLQNAVQAGSFDNFGGSSSADSPTGKGEGSSKNAGGSGPSNGGTGKRKKKGRKQW